MDIKDDLICGVCGTTATVHEVEKIGLVRIFAVECSSCKQIGPRIGFLLGKNRESDDVLAKQKAVKLWRELHA